MYRRTFENMNLKNHRVIDLRSDTLAVPTDEMRQAIFEAVIGDDVYGEDPTGKELEEVVAEMFGKEAAVFVPSGSMANLLAIMVHCDKRGSEVIVGNWSHIFRYEQGSASQLASVFIHNLANSDDGTFSIEEVKKNVRGGDFHEPITQLVVVEQTHNMAGGKVIPLEWIEELSKVCKENKLKLHMDGARIFNAAEYLKVPVSRVARDVDSVCFCLSKNLCCPVGSLLVGTKQFVDQARRLRKALGGGMRQIGFIAAAGLCALNTIVPQLGFDHQHTRQFAEAIRNTKSSIFYVDLENLHTNILMIKVTDNPKKITSLTLSDRLAQVGDNEINDGICDDEKKPILIKSSCKNLQTLRVVFYHQINDELTKLAIKKVVYVIEELQK
ncbi:CLUMA_CG002599, isoform A [Clunio marinus]|uniref:CLUMA_CG002599, isoform A n=1 Tax=Clunio marinus TaxID=568069 RepID=A0A1J1HQL3_9DIPT|nr:CLUMA_CG002599, isoform A [Clunio marinus]